MPQSDQNPVDQLKARLSLSRDLSNHAAANHLKLRQNYLRLLEEQ